MSQANVTIRREDKSVRGRYLATVPGVEGEAELTYTRVNEHLYIAEHTEVPNVFRGQGLGRKLVTRMVEDARAQGFKIVPNCSYVDAERRKHPEWADVFETK